MARIVVTEFVSLDGVMEAPGGDDGFPRGAWSFAFDRGDEATGSSSTRCSPRTRCCSAGAPARASPPHGRSVTIYVDGSRTLVQGPLERDLVDELRLTDLRAVGPDGVFIQVYEPVR